MNIKIGPKNDPCGTPFINIELSELLIFVLCQISGM